MNGQSDLMGNVEAKNHIRNNTGNDSSDTSICMYYHPYIEIHVHEHTLAAKLPP